jgi:signal transduction histidine kinase
MNKPTPENVGKLLSLVVHDLRNPTAALSANNSYVTDVVASSDAGSIANDDFNEIKEALQDSATALSDLTRGLDQLAWVARWLAEVPVAQGSSADLLIQLRAIVAQPKAVPVELEVAIDGPVRIKGGEALPKLLEILIANAIQHQPQGTIRLVVRREKDRAVVEVRDRGCALAADLRDQAFTLEGQMLLKERSNGRYSRVVGLFAAGILAQSMGATLQADESEGFSVFRLTVQIES